MDFPNSFFKNCQFVEAVGSDSLLKS